MANTTKTSSWWVVEYFQPLVCALLLALIVGYTSATYTANQAYAIGEDNAKRIGAWETAPTRISVLETTQANQGEQLKRIEDKLDRTTELLLKMESEKRDEK